jgi:hypothetical protein
MKEVTEKEIYIQLAKMREDAKRLGKQFQVDSRVRPQKDRLPVTRTLEKDK